MQSYSIHTDFFPLLLFCATNYIQSYAEEGAHPQLISLAQECCAYEPEDRPDSKRIIEILNEIGTRVTCMRSSLCDLLPSKFQRAIFSFTDAEIPDDTIAPPALSVILNTPKPEPPSDRKSDYDEDESRSWVEDEEDVVDDAGSEYPVKAEEAEAEEAEEVIMNAEKPITIHSVPLEEVISEEEEEEKGMAVDEVEKEAEFPVAEIPGATAAEGGDGDEAAESKSTSGTYPYIALKGKGNCPAGVDPAQKELALSEAEFEEVFGLKRKEFTALPVWKQRQKKKNVLLF